MKRRHFLMQSTGLGLGLSACRPESSQVVAPLRIGLITDPQYADADPAGERHYRATPDKLRQAVRQLAAEKPAWTLQLGDLIDRDWASFEVMLGIFAGLPHPVHHLPGNHDFAVPDDEKLRVDEKIGFSSAPRVIRQQGFRFLFLDTNEVSSYRYPAADPRTSEAAQLLLTQTHEGAKPYNGGLASRQLQWLDQQLTEAGQAGEKAILCAHHPLLPATKYQLWKPEDVLAVIDRHPCVVAWLNGHHHDGNYAERHGVHYITFRSMLHEPGVNAWAVLDFFPDRLQVSGYGRQESMQLKWRV
jgi:manganese-dependent ADP-ribose/CDP-alcohol diphosphatase